MRLARILSIAHLVKAVFSVPLPPFRVAGVALSVLMAGSLWSGLAPATAQSPHQTPPSITATGAIDDAVQATRSARFARYGADVTVGAATITATGSVDLVGDRIRTDVRADGKATEFRRAGGTYYVDAQRLGAPGPRWVAFDPARGDDSPSARTMAGFVTAVSPGHALDALDSTVSATIAGADSLGTRYRVQVARSAASLIPLYAVLASDPDADSGRSTLDVWIDTRGRVARVSFAVQGMSWDFSLSGHGEAIDIAAPDASQTAGPRSPAGRHVFGSGGGDSSPRASARAVTANPTIELVDGVIRGNLNAVSSKGNALRLQAVSSGGGGKLLLGNVQGSQSFTVLPYANWLDGGARGVQTFTVKVTEVTRQAQDLTELPLTGGLAAAAIDLLGDTAGTGDAVMPLAGATIIATIAVDLAELAPEGTPVAFTYRVPSFDGTLISTNFFPATAVESAPVVLNGPGLGAPGSTNPYALHGSDPYVPGVLPLREAGYHVITWDPRGEFASGGILHFDNPFFEGRDVSAIVSWAAAQPSVQLNAPGDPVIGMVGGSYGGGIQLSTAAMDPRFDAIVPAMAWNSLIETMSPQGVFKKQAASTLLAGITSQRIRINSLLRQGLQESIARGKLSDTTRTLLASNDMDPLLRQLQAPTLLVQSVADVLFPLEASIRNAQAILANPYGTPVKLIWIDPANDDEQVAAANVIAQSIMWLDKYIRGVPIPDAAIPAFQWWDQSGNRQTSTLLPFEPGFNQATPISATAKGGSLTFTTAQKPSTISFRAQVAAGAQVAGSPTMSFTYRGKGTAGAVYVQVANLSTKKVLGNVVTPIPVTLDGRERTVSIPLGDIVYTSGAASSLSITIMSSSADFASSGTGRVAVSSISVAIPQRSS